MLDSMFSRVTSRLFPILVAIAGLAACSKGEPGSEPGGKAPATAPATAGEPALATDFGVDAEKKILRIGLLNDESGPAAALGKPYAAGKRLLAAQINAGDSRLLPEGWRVELIERDHQYNPQKSVQAYQDIRAEVLFMGHSFGTPNTLPLHGMLVRDQIIAFPASLSSEVARHPNTPPIGPSYLFEAMRAMDFAVEQAGGAAKVRAAIVYQKDDYGKDGLDGWRAAAKHHGVEIVSEQTVAPGQKDFTAIVTALEDAGATHVLLTVLAGATGAILGSAKVQQYAPVWIGNTPAWIDRFYDPSVIPPAVFEGFHVVTGLSYWNEDLPGMQGFLAAYEAHGKDLHPPDFFLLNSYVQGRIGIEAFSRALAKGDVTREAFMAALRSIASYDGGGLIQPLDFTKQPYETSRKTRVLAPDLANRSFTVVAPYAEPQAPVPAEAATE